jgi:antirestriction protein
MQATTNTTNAAGATSPADGTAAAAEVRIYCGTYKKYNSGSIKGAWLDLSAYADRDELIAACKELHADEQDPELMFQDFAGFPRAWYEESSAPSDILWEWMEIGEETERDAFGVYANHMGGDITKADFREAYQGTADSKADFAETLAEETESIPKSLPSWIVIDWEASWNCNLRFDYWAERGAGGDLHFFRDI